MNGDVCPECGEPLAIDNPNCGKLKAADVFARFNASLVFEQLPHATGAGDYVTGTGNRTPPPAFPNRSDW